MKNFKSLILLIAIGFTTSNVFCQANPSVAILPLNAFGEVAVDAIMDVKITINNTGTATIVAAKLRPNITIPALAEILPSVDQTGLPVGWVIVSNAGGQIRVCNSADPMPGGSERNIIIKVKGVTIGGPTPCQVQMNFGGATCAVSGPQPSGNNTIDDFASSSVTVVAAPLPLTLLSFNTTLVKCESSLNWVTESEINTDRFEIERSTKNGNDWKTIGSVKSIGSSSVKNNYAFIDNANTLSKVKIFYRLKMIDKDGVYKYSPIVILDKNCTNTFVSIFPNPVKDGKLNVNITGFTANTTTTLLSASGERLMQTKMNNGTNLVNVSSLPNGIYILKVIDDNGNSKVEKVTIQR